MLAALKRAGRTTQPLLLIRRQISTTASAETMAATAPRFLADTGAPFSRLAVRQHFDALSPRERLYAHYIGRASWSGAAALSASCSQHSPSITGLFLDVFTSPDTRGTAAPRLRDDMAALKAASSVSETAWIHFLEYAVQALYNLSNFKSFGDTKFVPRVSKTDFATILANITTPAVQARFNALSDAIYGTDPPAQLLIGYPADGHVSGYYSENVSKDDVEFVQRALEQRRISALNTRLFKKVDAGVSYEVRVASAARQPPAATTTTFEVDGRTITVVYGDFSEQMAAAADALERALIYAANDNQRKMLEAYVVSLRTGSMDAHRTSQEHWIRDIGPVVESNLGFIETYRDPAGVRAEWEGFVAVVNKDMTLKFQQLVDSAPRFISLLPWSPAFEKDTFRKPDFTSLEVVSFATSGGPPSGINIPNYDDIRQTIGFKNVSLGNVISAKAAGVDPSFVHPDDMAMFKRLETPAFEIQVGIHELLGHGSGKLLQEESPDKFNFDISKPPVSPITGKPITTWYKPGETWGSVFKSAAASYEECRAESVAMFLCVEKDILDIFGVHGGPSSHDDMIHTCYMLMSRNGLMALEFYDSASHKWGQAHMQARFAILRVLMRAGVSTVIETTDAETGKRTLVVRVDRSRIRSHGIPAMGDFLQKLNVFKATADAGQGLAFYHDATAVSDESDAPWLAWREVVLANKKPRMVLIQPNTVVDEANGTVELREYPLTHEGLIQSYVERAIIGL